MYSNLAMTIIGEKEYTFNLAISVLGIYPINKHVFVCMCVYMQNCVHYLLVHLCIFYRYICDSRILNTKRPEITYISIIK